MAPSLEQTAMDDSMMMQMMQMMQETTIWSIVMTSSTGLEKHYFIEQPLRDMRNPSIP